MNILFTCAGRRNYLIEYFKKELKGKGKVVAADMQMSAPAMAVADKACIVPEVYAPGYIEALKNICIEEKINAIFSLNDLELPILSEAKETFDSIGVKMIISSPRVIDLSFDKAKTMEFVASLGLRTPKTFQSLADAKKAIQQKELSFPLVIKPRWGSASIGIEFPMNEEELELSYSLIILKIKRSILARASSTDMEHSILIQEKINGKEFGLDVLNDFNGNTRAVYVKEKLAMRAGETDKAVLVDLPEVEKIGTTIGSHLKHVGNLDCDVMEMEGRYYFIEMNPRFGGGYPFTYMSGGNFPAILLQWLENKDAIDPFLVKHYNSAFSKCDQLIKIKV